MREPNAYTYTYAYDTYTVTDNHAQCNTNGYSYNNTKCNSYAKRTSGKSDTNANGYAQGDTETASNAVSSADPAVTLAPSDG